MTKDEVKFELDKVGYIEIFPDRKENGDNTLFLVCNSKSDCEKILGILSKHVLSVNEHKSTIDNYIITLLFEDLTFDYHYIVSRSNDNFKYFDFLKNQNVKFINTAYINGKIFDFDIS